MGWEKKQSVEERSSECGVEESLRSNVFENGNWENEFYRLIYFSSRKAAKSQRKNLRTKINPIHLWAGINPQSFVGGDKPRPYEFIDEISLFFSCVNTFSVVKLVLNNQNGVGAGFIPARICQ